MNKTNRNRDRNKQIIPLAAIALSAVVLLTGVVSIATSGTKAKYRQTVQAGDGYRRCRDSEGRHYLLL